MARENDDGGDPPWRLEASEPVLDSPWMRVERNTYLLPSGTRLSDYYLVRRRDFVLVVARAGDRLVMVRQYRPATQRRYLSVPGGYIDDGEQPEEAAARELREETGLEGTGFRVLAELDPLPGYLRSRAFVVLCEVPGVRPSTEDGDEIEEVWVLPLVDVLARIGAGEIDEMQAVAAILLAQLPDGAA